MDVYKPRIKQEILRNCDVVVDGLYIDSLKNSKLQFRGSSNQRIIDTHKSTYNKVALWTNTNQPMTE